MDKVYIVRDNNGEPYEDNIDMIVGVFTSYDYAVEYIEELGCIKTDNKWRETWELPKYVCSMGNIHCEDCPKFDIDSDEDDCGEYDKRMDSAWNNGYYYIEEYRINK